MRIFKTRAFATAARKALISDGDLRRAMLAVMAGQADYLGGGIWKKRLKENRHRSIILARGGNYWVYEFLYAKQDQASLSYKELSALRGLAKAYAGLSGEQIQCLLDREDFMEITHEQEIQQ